MIVALIVLGIGFISLLGYVITLTNKLMELNQNMGSIIHQFEGVCKATAKHIQANSAGQKEIAEILQDNCKILDALVSYPDGSSELGMN